MVAAAKYSSTLRESVRGSDSILQDPAGLVRSRDLAKMYRENKVRTQRRQPMSRGMRDFVSAIEEGKVSLLDFGLRHLFEALVPKGDKLIEHMDDQRAWMNVCAKLTFSEAEGTTTADFVDISYELLSSVAFEKYNSPMFIGDQLTTNMPSKLKVEKSAGLAHLGDVAQEVDETEVFPSVKRVVDYVTIGEAKKRGLQLPVSREAIFFNRTNEVIDDAQEVAETLRINKEKRILNVVMGTVNNWEPKQDHLTTTTYQNGGGSPAAFDNTSASTPMESWRDLDKVRQLARDMTDPNTGEPIDLGPMPVLLVPDEIVGGVDRWVNALQVREIAGVYAGDNSTTPGPQIETLGPNPVNRYKPTVLSNQYVSLLGDATTTFYGNPKKAFVYKEHWPFNMLRVPMNSHYMATHDLVADIVASEYGDPFVKNPRYMFKCTA